MLSSNLNVLNPSFFFYSHYQNGDNMQLILSLKKTLLLLTSIMNGGFLLMTSQFTKFTLNLLTSVMIMTIKDASVSPQSCRLIFCCRNEESGENGTISSGFLPVLG